MSYGSCGTALLTVLTGITGYTTSNITHSDYHVLNQGYDKSIVLRPGAFNRERYSFPDNKQTQWDIIIELFIRYKDDAQVNEDIRIERQKILDRVDLYPKLNAATGVFDAQILSGAEPQPVFGANGTGPHMFMQEMICKITEDVEIASLE